MIPLDDVLLQDEFFNYLLSYASEGKYNVYVDTVENEFKFLRNGEFNKDFQSGYFFRMQKEKNEVAITDFDTISYYQYGLSQIFYYKQIISCPPLSIENLEAAGVKYGAQRTMSEIQHTIDEVFFGKRLINNYFTNSEDSSIQDSVVKFSLITSRNRLFSWFYKGDNTGIEHLLEYVSLDLIRNCIAQGYDNKARHQLNLRWSFIDYFSQTDKMEVIMSEVRQELRKHINLKEDWDFSGDKEYYYAVGQLVNYLLGKIKSKNRPQSLVNPFLNAKRDELVRKQLKYLYKQVNYDIDLNSKRVNNLIGHIMTYQNVDQVDQEMLIGGFTDNSLIYEKEEETAK